MSKIGAAAFCAQMSGWDMCEGERDAVCKRYAFHDFKIAWAFMSAAALKAEQMDHHPEWSNIYNRVDVTLTTHDADGVTDKDLALARFMDELARKLG